MRIHCSLMIIVLCFGSVSMVESAASGEPDTLCAALKRIRPGESLPVRLSGVYFTGYEQSLLYDPAETLCDVDVQPTTWVEFGKSVSSDTIHKLTKLLRRSNGRARVLFEGELHGPVMTGADDISLPVRESFARRTTMRYGHLNRFRTALTVTRIVEMSSVGALAEPVLVRPAGTHQPEVIGAVEYRYPQLAMNASIQGTVELEVSVTNGVVTSVMRSSGDRILADAAVENIRNWRFRNEFSGAFGTIFTYRLDRCVERQSCRRVELALPYRVTIIDALDEW